MNLSSPLRDDNSLSGQSFPATDSKKQATRCSPGVRPLVAIHDNPFERPLQSVPVPFGTRIDALVSADTPGAMVRLNGEWLLRADWHHPLLHGDILEVHVLPQGGGGGSNALRVVLMIAAAVYAPAIAGALFNTTSAFAVAGTQLALMAGINAILPAQSADAMSSAGAAPSPTYNTSLSGNTARLDQPIPVIYGRHLVYPDFASQPYTEFDNATNDQYYHAILCVGMGHYVLEQLSLDDTPIDHFQDVAWRFVLPGTPVWYPPTFVGPAPGPEVLPNVVTAPEVSGQDLLTGRFVGGFAASGPTQKASAIGIDIICPRGLGVASSGGAISSKTVVVRADYRTINDFGTATSGWVQLASISIEGATNSQVRRSYKYTLPTPSRVEIRLARTDVRDENQLVLNDVTWAGLRAYLDLVPPLATNATHIVLRMRASEQLNGLSQRRIAAVVRRLLRTWDPANAWGPLVETRSIAWALADKWTNAEYGDGLPDTRCDLLTLHRLDQVWAQRQDRLDIVFDSTTDSDSADQMIARAGRARVFRRNGVRTVVRDESQDLPVTAYGSRDLTPGSAQIDYVTDVSKLPDAIIVEYFDYRAWDWRTITCKAPGVATPVRPEYMRLPGITGPKQAEREGLYEAAARFYRRRYASWQTELQGMLPTLGSAVLFAPALRGWGQSGDITAWDPVTVTASLSEPPAWAEGQNHWISIVRDNGSLTDLTFVTPGPTAWDVQLDDAPDVEPVVDDGMRERTRYVFGTATTHERIVRILGIRPQATGEDGSMLVAMNGVLEDERVHLADIHLLPGPGDIQDPIDIGTAVGGDGTSGANVIVKLSGQFINSGAPYEFLPDPPPYCEFALLSNGRARITTRVWTAAESGFTHSDVVSTIGDEWSLGGLIEASAAADFEVAVAVTGSGGDFAGTVGTWLNLATDRAWSLTGNGSMGVVGSRRLDVQIRNVPSGLQQARATVDLNVGIVVGGA